jgi:hypothetical protein
MFLFLPSRFLPFPYSTLIYLEFHTC